MDKVVERWRSDRMQQDITLARWGRGERFNFEARHRLRDVLKG